MTINIKQVQRLLTGLGFDLGKVDGIWGTKSQAALDAAEKKHCKGSSFDSLVETTVSTEAAQSDADFWKTIRYFRREEFRCKCGGKYCNGFPVEPDRGLVLDLDKLRAKIGHEIIVNSGIRCKKHNAAVGGAAASQHLLGTAADIRCPNLTPAKLYTQAEKLIPNSGGLGRYADFVHFDERKNKARWSG